MSCQIIRDPATGVISQVLTPTLRPSNLYHQILSAIRKNPGFQPDQYVQAALDRGMIKGHTPEEYALAIWSKIYTPAFRNWYGNWEEAGFPGLLDAAGEPILSIDAEGRFSQYKGDYLRLDEAPDYLEYQLEIPREAVVDDPPTTEAVVKRKFDQLQQEMKTRYPDQLLEGIEQADGRIRTERKKKLSLPAVTKIPLQELIYRMQQQFPQLKASVITEQDLNAFQFGTEIDRDSISSFVQGGTVYLVDSRITPETVIEEFLHPFVAALETDNKSLFDELLTHAQQQEPGIVQLVERNYSSFDRDSRNNEIVTQVLAKGLADRLTEHYTGEPQQLSLLRRFLQFLTRLLGKLTGKTTLYVGQIPSDLTLEELITLLQDGQPVNVGPLNATTYFHLQDEKLELYNHILHSANVQQREIVEKLVNNGVLFYESTHKYVHADTGEELNSVTKLMKGQIDDQDPYAINRAFGKEFDFVMNAILLGKQLPEIRKQLRLIRPDVLEQFYNHLQVYIAGIRSNGSIVIPQLVVADIHSKVAGTLDLLIIDPFGNMDIIDLKISKNSVLGKSYDKPWPVSNNDSLFVGSTMSTRAQHGIQQHSYKKLIELQQYQVRSVKTLHFHIIISHNMVTAFNAEGLIDHTTTNYSKEVDRIIPTEIPRSPNYITLLQAQALPENAPTVERIQDVVRKFQEHLEQRKNYFENINTLTKGKTRASEEYLTDLSETINLLTEELTKGSPVGGFYELLKFINRDLKKKTSQLGSTTIRKEKLIDFLLEAEKDLQLYSDILEVPQLQLNNPVLHKLAREAQEFADALRTAVDVEIKEFMRDFIKTNTSRDLTAEELDTILTESRDISKADYLLGDLATSPDTLLAVFDKVYKRKLQQIYDETDTTAQTLQQIGNRLARLSGGQPNYDFMFYRDATGKPTGYHLRKIGNQYWDKLSTLRAATQDENGVTRKYKEIFTLLDADPAHLAYNLDLMKRKNELREFMMPEFIDEKGRMQDGIYHQYTAEFKKIRDQYEALHVEMNNGKVVYHEWRKKRNVADEDYKRYLARYYTPEINYLSPVKDQVGPDEYEYMGRVVEKSNRFVKSEFTEPRELSGWGESMLDPQYEKVMNPTTELGKVQKEFFETWSSIYEAQINKLPADVRKKMSGRLPVIRDKFLGTIKTKPTSWVKGVLKSFRNLNPLDLKVYSQSMLTNSEGEIENQVPIYYVGDFQSEHAIRRLESQIRELREQLRNKTITYEAYKEQLKKAQASLSIEKGKITRDELATDMVASLVEFSKMAENYQVLANFESTVKSTSRVITERKYYKEGSAGMIMSRNNQQPVRLDGADSLVAKRLNKWMEMVLYRTNNPYQSKLGQVVRKMMQYMSLKNVALNPFGQLNNYLVGKMNNAIETTGAAYWSREAMLRAVREYNLSYLPGFFAKRSAKLIAQGDYYKIDRPYSKYEALASHFRMMRKLQSADLSEGLKDRVFDSAYIMQESAEYNIQTKTGMALLMTKTLTNTQTGVESSIYDAYEFDQRTHTLQLKPGFSLSDTERHDLTNRIYEVNKQLHGNYAYEDRMVIQEHLLGELAAQFHKWIYPAFKARVKKGYYDENLGDVEGRHLSVWKLMTYLVELRDLAQSWDLLQEHQKRNVYKAAADLTFMLMSFALYHLFIAIGSGIDEEDETTRKLVNWMTSQSDRLYDEVAIGVFVVGTQQQYQLLKSPIALLGTAKDGMEVIHEALKLPFPPYDDHYFKKGVNKGELKLKKELMDVIPVLNLVNRWDSYETVKQFYIR